MRRGYRFILTLGLLLGLAGPLRAHVFLTGFPGGPGAYGVCARSCHGYPGGTIYVDRFPAQYRPAQTYCIKVGHNAGDSIENFNCAIKIGDTNQQAGQLLPGYYTEVYHDSITGDGVRALGRCDTCNFYWIAPDAGTGTVRLYFGGFQGVEGEWGRNSEWILVSSEYRSGVEAQGSLPLRGESFGLRLAGANPVRGSVALAYSAWGAEPARLRVYNLTGHVVRSFALEPRAGVLRWDGRDLSGRPVPKGVYLFRLVQGCRTATGKALLLR